MSKRVNDLDNMLANYGKASRTANAQANTEKTTPKSNKVKPSRTANGRYKNVTIKVNGRHKTKVTKRDSFENTLDLKAKLDDYIKKSGANKSEFIRRAIAKELNKVNKG